MAGTSTTLQTLHYLTPVVVLATFFGAKSAATCLLHKPSKDAGNTKRRWSAIVLILGTLCTFVAQGILCVAQSLRQPGFWAKEDYVIYVLASVLAFSVQVLGLTESATPVWHPYGLSCFLAAILEILISVFEALALTEDHGFASSKLALQIVRSAFLVIFCVSAGWFALRSRSQNPQDNDETEPLFPEEANGDIHKPKYGTVPESQPDADDNDSLEDIDSDEEDPVQARILREQQRKRVQESGSWLNYLGEFKIFLPMLWPYRNRFVQGCLLVIGLVLAAERVLNVLVPRQLGIITDQLAAGYGNGIFPWKAVVIWMIFTWLQSRAGLFIIQELAELPVQQFTYKSIGATSFAHIMALSMDFHNEKNSGELIQAIDQGQNLQDLLQFGLFQVAPMFVDLIVAFVYVYTLFDVYVSFILMVIGIGYIWIGAKTNTWSIKQRRRYNTTMRNESKVQNEAINNWQTVSHFNRGKYESERYEKSIDEFTSAEISYYMAFYLGGSAQTLIMVLGRLAATSLAIYRVSQGTVPIGNFIALTAYWYSIESPLSELSWSIRRVTQMLTDSERLLQLFLKKPSVSEVPNAVEISVEEGHVEFKNVDFSYDGRRSTLQDVSFAVKPGQTVALVGETGGGKSTILKLLYRYYDVSSGVIRIDGQDIRGVTLDSLRDLFGMVPQDPALFNCTIMENVRYGRLDATDDEVMDACRAAAIHNKIETFADGYKSTVGERGVKLSGGELQRIAIARAILRKPKIVLLDEATSMIDAETESVIQKAFKRLTESRTTFIIAHRLSTIQHADQILVINDGEIVERGTHDELFRKNGKYVALWSKQLSRDVQDVGKTLDVSRQDEQLIDFDDTRAITAHREENSSDDSGSSDEDSTGT